MQSTTELVNIPQVSIEALHEAAHAVIAAHMRVPFSRVTIKPNMNSRGHVTIYHRNMPKSYEVFEQAVLTQAYRRLPAETVEANEGLIIERAISRAVSSQRRSLTNKAIVILAARAVVSKYSSIEQPAPEWHYAGDEAQLREIAVAMHIKKCRYKAWRKSLYRRAQEIINLVAVELAIRLTAFELDQQKTLTSKHVRGNLRFWENYSSKSGKVAA
jgi:hypothetical protein